ncbi:hypothetical protein [Kutzneria buriramensis]|uniref:Uncharacterized protein n=1 Tax=Kutzneria buriramensis TaxID=1045776 RepID=A0A3E0GXS6_9PSEU|nr:hypothetical protein [Kutzneria buriramensis]REH30712.1 hypothetical protein BCF44_12370 [Kutzneria buriramensis]
MLLTDDPTPWYDTTWLWGAVSAVIALAVLYVAWRAIPARPTTIYFWRFDAIQLVRSNSSMPVTLEIRRNHTVLRDPHLVQVLLATRGRADVGQDAFNGPIMLDIGAPIVDVLKFESDADHIPAPPWQAEGSTLHVGPALLARRHELTFSLLVDGPPISALTLTNRPRDVTVQAAQSNAAGPSPLDPGVRLAACGAIVFGVMFVVMRSSVDPLAKIAALYGVFLLGAMIVVPIVQKRLRRRIAKK